MLVETELKKPKVPEKVIKKSVKPDKVQQQYEVVDGTTIYANPVENIAPSSTESPILSTASPLSDKDVKVEQEAQGKIINFL